MKSSRGIKINTNLVSVEITAYMSVWHLFRLSVSSSLESKIFMLKRAFQNVYCSFHWPKKTQEKKYVITLYQSMTGILTESLQCIHCMLFHRMSFLAARLLSYKRMGVMTWLKRILTPTVRGQDYNGQIILSYKGWLHCCKGVLCLTTEAINAYKDMLSMAMPIQITCYWFWNHVVRSFSKFWAGPMHDRVIVADKLADWSLSLYHGKHCVLETKCLILLRHFRLPV